LHNGNQNRFSISEHLARNNGTHCESAPDSIFRNPELIESRNLVSVIDGWLDELKPTLLISHGVYQGDHQEHRVVGNAITVCWLRYNVRHPGNLSRLLRIAPLPYGLGFVPTTFTAVGDVLQKKEAALDLMNALLPRAYLNSALHRPLATDLGDRYFAATSSPIEIYEEELRSGILPLLQSSAPDERHATSLMVTTPLPVARATASPDALKLIAEEYRVCTARADELQRLIWQVFVVIGAITSVLATAMVRLVGPDSVSMGPQIVLVVCFIGILFLGVWSRIATKWSAQMRNYYQRIESLEKHLHFRTNSQTKRLDDTLGRGKGYTISRMREWLAIVLVLGWSVLAAFASYVLVASVDQPTAVSGSKGLWDLSGIAAATIVFFALIIVYQVVSRSPYKPAQSD